MDELLFDIFGEMQLATVVKCLKTLSAFNIVETWPVIETILVDDDNFDHFDKKRQITAILRTHLTEVLNAHWVFVEDNAPLHIINALTYTLFDSVADYEPTAILNAVALEVTEENPAEAAYVALVAYLRDIDPMILIDYIRMVDSTVVKNIVKALETKDIPDLEAVEPEYKERYLKFVGAKRTGLIYEYIAMGGVIGKMGAYPLILMLEDALDGLPVKDLVFEAASLILISSDTVTISTINQVAQFLAEDAIVHDKLTSELKLLLGVSNEA